MMVAHFIKAKPFYFGAPDIAPDEPIKLLRSITEAREIFAQGNDTVWTLLLRIFYKLQLVKASSTRFIIAGDYDLFLLDGEWQVTKLRVFSLEYTCVEAVVILSKRQLDLLHSQDQAASGHTKCIIILWSRRLGAWLLEYGIATSSLRVLLD